MNARGLQSFVAKLACAIRISERHDDKISLLHLADVGSDGLDDADGFVAHAASLSLGAKS